MERESMKFAKDKLLIKLVLVLLLVLSISILAAAVSAVPPMAKPGCQDRCGNLSIPFPFGTNQDCYLDEAFLITCNTTTNKPFLRRSNREVRNISLDGWVRIYSDAAFNCYGEKGLGFDYETWIKLSQFYSLSYEVNKFVAVGCDTTATFTSDTYPAGYSYFTGCKSSCYSIDFISNGSCSGFGCCQVPVPKGVWSLNISLTRFYNDSTVLSYNPCSYGFVVEDGFYNFNSVDLANLETIQFPVALDWTIGNTTCAQAKRNLIAYACLAKNSKCVDSNTRPAGYLCECPDGYHGNPYLSNGCQDVDECSYPNSTIKCVSNSTCSNTIGNYECICPEGYFGDGLLEGLGCFPRKSSKSEILIVHLFC